MWLCFHFTQTTLEAVLQWFFACANKLACWYTSGTNRDLTEKKTMIIWTFLVTSMCFVKIIKIQEKPVSFQIRLFSYECKHSRNSQISSNCMNSSCLFSDSSSTQIACLSSTRSQLTNIILLQAKILSVYDTAVPLSNSKNQQKSQRPLYQWVKMQHVCKVHPPV